MLAEGELAPRDLGVITPYAAQAALISKQLQRLPAPLGAAEVEVSSVDGFQGREKELILISTVRANRRRALGFVADARRLNVMITRARRGLVLFGALGLGLGLGLGIGTGLGPRALWCTNPNPSPSPARSPNHNPNLYQVRPRPSRPTTTGAPPSASLPPLASLR